MANFPMMMLRAVLVQDFKWKDDDLDGHLQEHKQDDDAHQKHNCIIITGRGFEICIQKHHSLSTFLCSFGVDAFAGFVFTLIGR